MNYFTYGNGNQNAYKCLKEKLMNPNISSISPPPSIYTLRMTYRYIYTHTHIYIYEKVKMLVTQVCPPLCDSMDCSPPGSSVHGILWTRILKWLPFPSPGDLPRSGIEPESPVLASVSFTTEPPEKPMDTHTNIHTHTYIYTCLWHK